MSDILNKAAEAMNTRFGKGFPARAKFEIVGEGCIFVDGTGARVADEPAQVTLSADLETFVALFERRLNPMSAYMSGKLRVEGEMGVAMRIAQMMD